MIDRNLTFFVSDVHLGLAVKGPADREARFVSFLKSIPPQRTEALYMLGDIWDFWYEYHDVVPKGYVSVFSALLFCLLFKWVLRIGIEMSDGIITRHAVLIVL